MYTETELSIDLSENIVGNLASEDGISNNLSTYSQIESNNYIKFSNLISTEYYNQSENRFLLSNTVVTYSRDIIGEGSWS